MLNIRLKDRKDNMEERKETNSALTLKDLWLVIKKNWLIILIVTLVVTSLGIVYGFVLKKDNYSASSSVIITSQEIVNEYDQGISSMNEALLATSTIKEFMVNDIVISKVADELSTDFDNYKYQDLKSIIREGLTIKNSTQSLILNINFSTNTSKILESDKEKFAVSVVNCVAKESIKILNETVENDKGEQTYKYGKLIANRVQQVSSATTCQVTRDSIKIVLIFFVLGLLIGYLTSFIKYIAYLNKGNNKSI